jgi:hypothetical protein
MLIDELQEMELMGVPSNNFLANEFLASIVNFLSQPNQIVMSINPKNGLSYADILHLSKSPNLLINLLNINIR